MNCPDRPCAEDRSVFAAAVCCPRSRSHRARPRPPRAGCLPGGNGYLRARVGGAMNLEINWRQRPARMRGQRPSGRQRHPPELRRSAPLGRASHAHGVRHSASCTEGKAGRGLPTNVTVIFEGETRLFATRGDDRCTVDELAQERIGALGGPLRSYRVVGQRLLHRAGHRLKGEERIVAEPLRFRGRTTFEDDVAALATFPARSVEISSGAQRHRFDAWFADTPQHSAGTDVRHRSAGRPRRCCSSSSATPRESACG